MPCEFVAISDDEIPQAADPLFQHLGMIAARGSHLPLPEPVQVLQPTDAGERPFDIAKGVIR